MNQGLFHALGSAAAQLDAVEAEYGTTKALEAVRLDMKTVSTVARQRALRMILALEGEPIPQDVRFVSIPAHHIELHASLLNALREGIAIGWAAHHIEEGT